MRERKPTWLFYENCLCLFLLLSRFSLLSVVLYSGICEHSPVVVVNYYCYYCYYFLVSFCVNLCTVVFCCCFCWRLWPVLCFLELSVAFITVVSPLVSICFRSVFLLPLLCCSNLTFDLWFTGTRKSHVVAIFTKMWNPHHHQCHFVFFYIFLSSLYLLTFSLLFIFLEI